VIRKRWCSEGHSLLREHKRTFARIFYIFLPIWINFGAEVSHNNLISDCELHKTRPNENQSLLWGVNDFLSYFLHFLADLGEIWCSNFSHKADVYLRVS
jgi:hypothetical protein